MGMIKKICLTFLSLLFLFTSKSQDNFKSNDLDNDFQNYCFDNISNITTHKGIQEFSHIAFIKKK